MLEEILDYFSSLAIENSVTKSVSYEQAFKVKEYEARKGKKNV